MDYREYRKKYASQNENKPESEERPASAPSYRGRGVASSSTGSVTRSYQTVRSKKKRYSTKKNKTSRALVFGFVALTVLILIVCLLVAFSLSATKIPECLARKVLVEAGRSAIQATDFLIDKSHTAEFAEGTEYSLDKVGKYSIHILLDETEVYIVTLEVEDTVAPTALPKKVTVRKGHEPKASNCVSNVTDITDVRASFAEKYNFNELGSHTVTVVLTDAAGNRGEVESTVNVVEDADVLTYEVDLEAGNPFPDIFEFVGEDGYGKYTGDTAAINTSVIGKYEMGINVSGKLYTVYVNVRDTVAPAGTVSPVLFYNSAYPSAEDFFTAITDSTEVTAGFAAVPNWNAGDQIPVKLKLTDRGGNTSVFETYATHKTDTKPPVITVSDSLLTCTVGDTALSWRSGITVTDDSGEEVEVTLDRGKADLDNAGTYTVYYVARDKAGNETRQAATLEVADLPITLDRLNAEYIKPILDGIIKPNMNSLEKAAAIFAYLTANDYAKLHYTDSTPHDDWIKRAYLGLRGTNGKRMGDCFVFASVAQAMFRYLGYDTVMIEKAEWAQEIAGGTHFWIMVNYGTKTNPQWYHFDGTPQTVRDNYYMMTTEQTEAFTEWRNLYLKRNDNFYAYDKTNPDYPASATKVLVEFSKVVPKEYRVSER